MKDLGISEVGMISNRNEKIIDYSLSMSFPQLTGLFYGDIAEATFRESACGEDCLIAQQPQ